MLSAFESSGGLRGCARQAEAKHPTLSGGCEHMPPEPWNHGRHIGEMTPIALDRNARPGIILGHLEVFVVVSHARQYRLTFRPS